MNTHHHISSVQSRTMHGLAICLALALPGATRVQAQCYIDPVTGQRVCAVKPLIPGVNRAPALDSRPSTLDSSAHCRISVADGTTGSGTLIATNGSEGLVLTCAHLFDSSTQSISVTFASIGRYAARLIERDRANDLAALTIQSPQIATIAVSNDAPAGLLTACGFGPNGQFRCIRGAIAGQATAVGASYPSLTICGAVRPGDSGGGLLNTSGELVGVIWGQRDGLTYATCGRPVREFLNRVCQRAGASPPPSGNMTDQTARINELDLRIKQLDAAKQPKGDYALRTDLANYLRSGDVPQLDTTQFANQSETDSRLKSLGERFESIRHNVEQIASAKGSFLSGLSTGKLIAATLGLSGPLAAAVIVATMIARRRIHKRIHLPALDPRPSSLDHSHPIVVDSPIPPQRTVPETHYVPIEKDSFAKAHQWASEHVARKYPGATEILQAQDSLIKQHLAAR
jgi:hypothetical protein